jgi:hypothetical protein
MCKNIDDSTVKSKSNITVTTRTLSNPTVATLSSEYVLGKPFTTPS